MPSVPLQIEPGHDFGIPGHLLNGATVLTVGQPDGSIVRMSYSHESREWRCLLIVHTNDGIVMSPLPPFSVVGGPQGIV